MRYQFRTFALALGIALVLPALLIGPATAANGDRNAPTPPTNVRVIGVTAYSVTLAWTAARDNVGVTSYIVCCSNANSQTFAAPSTQVTYSAGVEPGHTYTLLAYARDAAGNTSKASNQVTFTSLRDTTTPSRPAVSVTGVGPTHISLAWSSTDDSPNLWYSVTQNGAGVISGDKATSATFGALQPQTTYTFVVSVMDWGGNRSTSAPLSVTTTPRDTSDTTPPSAPGNLRTNGMEFPDGETWLFWDASTDNATPSSVIEYRVFVNGVLDNVVAGGTRDIVYGTPQSPNTYSVVAVDEAGNQSAPATIVVNNR